MIEVKNLHKKYANTEVLKGISLEFKSGEIVGVVGENGAGKTTFFKCLTGLENFEGEINYNSGILKNEIGFLSSEPYFLSKITGKEYLQLLCTARGINIKDFEEKNIFDLPLNKYAENYSTGMKKKLALTATLLQNNNIFIFDEPFNGVDIQSNVLIKEVLLKLKSLNKIVILSSHIFSTLTETCDKLYHLKNGVIINSATKENFATIEESMKEQTLSKKIDSLFN
ncbi:MAG: ABC transporter ATP-binding protein [Flavobacteriales bacterium]|nr:ABC transporter ATP-binding protein [Flavobacteriales bacterium]MCB9336352.1 ABC transporter ATP-binding protein [Flavobacteriales bacterium]